MSRSPILTRRYPGERLSVVSAAEWPRFLVPGARPLSEFHGKTEWMWEPNGHA
jgi:hypothetical protein